MSASTREQLNLAAHKLLSRAARRLNFDISDFYGPIVTVEPPPPGP